MALFVFITMSKHLRGSEYQTVFVSGNEELWEGKTEVFNRRYC
ncbi:hypothetical protein TDB9533_04498 [Thalassocella blandensis]|nr:hypothetical protein TDB9533_04498 [Thalassocella blandensis]